VLTAPFRFVEVPFDKDASITALGPIDGAGAHDAVVALARTCDDLFVFAHGWNNDVPEAQLLYSGILASLGAAWTAAGLGDADTSRTGVAAPRSQRRSQISRTRAVNSHRPTSRTSKRH
jgi:hypothetical protein